MPDESKSPNLAHWTRVADLDRLQPSCPIATKVAGKQIALFCTKARSSRNNRRPHEGYPRSKARSTPTAC
jgi:hypothetical protein